MPDCVNILQVPLWQPSFLTEIISKMKPDSSFQLSESDEGVIYNESAKLNVNKAAMPDEIPARMIKLCGQYILKPFTHVVNLSLQYYKVPTKKKKARVRVLYKNKCSKMLPNNEPSLYFQFFLKYWIK